MARYRVSFSLISYSKNSNSKSTASTSETVEAESESTAIYLAESKVKNKSIARGREVVINKVEKLR